MTDEANDPDVFVTLRMPASLHNAMKQAARDHERTLAGEVRQAIRNHVDTFVPKTDPS